MKSDGIQWISTHGGRFIILPDLLLPAWRGYSDGSLDPLDTAHDYGRACAAPGYAAEIPVGNGAGLVFGENESGGVWLRSESPMIFEWVYADSEASIVEFLQSLPDDLAADSEVGFNVIADTLTVFDSVFSGKDFGPQHSCRFAIEPGQYNVASTYYEPDENTALIVHRFQRTPTPSVSRQALRQH